MKITDNLSIELQLQEWQLILNVLNARLIEANHDNLTGLIENLSRIIDKIEYTKENA